MVLRMVLAASLAALAGCGPSSSASKGPPGLILNGAFFEKGKPPMDARLLVARPPQGPEDKEWTIEAIDCGDKSNVFHKGLYFEPVSGEPGILSVAAAVAGTAPAYVKLWRQSDADGKWTAETLYEGVFGGKFDRCRDLEVGDVNGDGVEDIVVVTHRRGVVVVIEQKDGGFVPTQIDGNAADGEEVWIHEVELGDVDGDGIDEIFATPSAPNKLDGKEQPGQIVMYDFKDGKYDKKVVEEFTSRHVKEILCTDLDGDGVPTVFASLEGENIGAQGGATTEIKEYKVDKDLEVTAHEVLPLPGKMCRFLSSADTTGDGNQEIIASTEKDGIWSIYRKDGAWTKTSVAPGSLTSGFEHASMPLDHDGDGIDEIFAFSDPALSLRRFYYDPERGRYRSEKIFTLKNTHLGVEGQVSAFIFNIEKLPGGR